MSMPVKIFFCYAHEDELLLNKLKAHLRPLQRQGLIDVWHDRDISAGTKWEEEINTHLNEANIILLLVSPDFMDSDYCYGKEMQRASERDQRGEARVIPIILRPVYWQGILGKLQALPTNGKPVISWAKREMAFFNVAEGIRKVVEEPAKSHLGSSAVTVVQNAEKSNTPALIALQEEFRFQKSKMDTHEQARCEQVVKQLTPRQREVLQAFAEGLTIQEVAERLCITIGTVDAHKTKLLELCREVWDIDQSPSHLGYHFLYKSFAPYFDNL
jgi:RNA polymerase sigma factor (sigma-70 family)